MTITGNRRVRSALTFTAGAALLLTVLPATSAAAASTSGTLDPTFSGDGVYKPRLIRGTTGSASDPRITAVEVAGGRIWLGAVQSGNRTSVQRIDSDGTASSTFNRGYPLALSFPPSPQASENVGVLQVTPISGGAFVLVARQDALTVVKVRDNGTVDRSLASSSSGRTPVIDIGSGCCDGSMAVLPDGRVLVAPRSDDGTVVGLRADGRRDSAVGPGGVTHLSSLLEVRHLLVRPGGGLFAVGREQVGFDPGDPRYRLKAVRLYRNAAPDPSPSWGVNGVAYLTSALAAVGSATRPVVTSTGALVVASEETPAFPDNPRATVRKLTPAGAIDQAFGPGGGRGFGPPPRYCCVSWVTGLDVTPGGKLMVAVENELNEGESTVDQLFRLNGTTGAFDRSFGKNGVVSTDVGSRAYAASALSVDSKGRTLVGTWFMAYPNQKPEGGKVRRYLP